MARRILLRVLFLVAGSLMELAFAEFNQDMRLTGLRAGEDALLRWLDRPLIGGGLHGRMLRGWFGGSSESKKDTAHAASCNLHVDFTKCPPDHSIPACCSKGGALDCVAVESALESASGLAFGRATEDDLPTACGWWAGPRRIRSCCAIP